MNDVFPVTAKTIIGEWLNEGDAGQEPLCRHLMDVYYEPLRIYCLGLSYYKAHRDRFESPEALVAGFFASRCSRPDYIRKWYLEWEKNPIPLRKWLRNGFILFVREEIAKFRRDDRYTALDEETAESLTEESPDEAFEREYCSTLIRLSMKKAGKDCESRGLERHWGFFVETYENDRSPAELAKKSRISAERVRTMIRTARNRMRQAIEDMIRLEMADPTPSKVRAEIRSLLGDAWMDDEAA